MNNPIATKRSVRWLIVCVVAVVCGFVLLYPVDFESKFASSALLRNAGFGITDGSAVDLEQGEVVVAPHLDQELEDVFGIGMSDDGLTAYRAAYEGVFAADNTAITSSVQSDFRGLLGDKAEELLARYSRAGCTAFKASSAGTYFVRSLLIQSALRIKTGEYEESLQILRFVVRYIASPKWFSDTNDLNYFYDEKTMALLVSLLHTQDLLSAVGSEEREEFAADLSLLLEDLESDNWRRFAKRSVLQYAIDALNGKGAVMSEGIVSRMMYRFISTSSVAAYKIMQRDLIVAWNVCDGKKVHVPFFFVVSTTSRDAIRAIRADQCGLALEVALLRYVTLIEDFIDKNGEPPRSLEQLDLDVRYFRQGELANAIEPQSEYCLLHESYSLKVSIHDNDSMAFEAEWPPVNERNARRGQ